MSDAIVHRGPDASGHWLDFPAGYAVAHRRLSILDLSDAGAQPMLSRSSRWVIAFNGEIYNHLDLRRELNSSGVAWVGHSDTETLLAAIEAWGVETTLRRSVGMFAIALWDRQNRVLWLARDRMGEKPLYFGWHRGVFLFGSEVRALREHPSFDGELDRASLALLMRHGYVPGPRSIYAGISKLPAGAYLKVSDLQRRPLVERYWSLAAVAEQGAKHQFSGSESQAVDEVERLLRQSVHRQMLSDVPIGALLSGGIDSSAIAALMQAQSARPVRTFTIGFEERAYDEAAHARAVAAHLGTDHTEVRLLASDAIRLVPKISGVYDEPFADSSQLPTRLVMELARSHVTVALSGDAGDEIFGGYNRYLVAPRLWNRVRGIPHSVRGAVGAALTLLPSETINRFAGPIAQRLGVAQPGDKLIKIGRRLKHVSSVDDLYVSLVSEWESIDDVVQGVGNPYNFVDDRASWPKLEDPVSRMMAMDSLTYLPDDILTKVDRASMSVSLEARAPMLDRDLIEFVWSLPLSMKVKGGRGKHVLRLVLDRYVPRRLVERPKMGFGIPLDQWLRGPLRDWVESLISEQRLKKEGNLNSVPVRAAWKRHLNGSSFGHRLWSVLMFQSWLETQKQVR